MKPIIEWLKELPEPERGEALRLCQQKREYWDRNSMTDALAAAFWWCSPQKKYKYWSKIYERYERAEMQQRVIKIKKILSI